MSTDTSKGIASSDWVGARGEKWRAQLPAMEAMLAPVDAPLFEALALEGPSRIADLGCGGGGTTFALARHAPAGSVVTGYDISPTLLEEARLRAAREGAAVQFVCADLGTAASPSNGFDRLASRFGVMFFDDPAGAFANLRRWLVPGGRFAFAVWAKPSDNPWMTSTAEVVGRFVEVAQTDPEAPGPFRYAEVAKLVTLLEAAGFAGVTTTLWRGALPIGGGLDAEAAADFALAAFSSYGEAVAKAGVGAAVKQALVERFAREVRDGVVAMEAAVHLVTGRG